MFIPGRYTGENIRISYDILEQTNKQDIPGPFLIVDLVNVFDCISRKFIVECLEFPSFGSTFTKWICALISRTTALIHQNGYLSRSILMERGCRQGDPVSPYLFVIGIPILNYLIQSNKSMKGISANGTEHKSIQYADDTQVLLDGRAGSLRAHRGH